MHSDAMEARGMYAGGSNGRHGKEKTAVPEGFGNPGGEGYVVPGEGAANYAGDEDGLGFQY
jgi:hypothetical protein